MNVLSFKPVPRRQQLLVILTIKPTTVTKACPLWHWIIIEDEMEICSKSLCTIWGEIICCHVIVFEKQISWLVFYQYSVLENAISNTVSYLCKKNQYTPGLLNQKPRVISIGILDFGILLP